MTRERDEQEPGTHTRLDLEALKAAGDVEIIRPGTPEAAAELHAMRVQLHRHDRALVARDGPEAMTSVRLLRQAAIAAEARPGTIGHALARYREDRGWTRADLADWLGVTTTTLAAMALEPVPRPEALSADENPCEQLGERFDADAGRLAEALG